MKLRRIKFLETSLTMLLCLIICILEPARQVAAETNQSQSLTVSSKNTFRAIHQGSRYTIVLKGKGLKKCQTSQKSVVAVKGKGTLEAKKPGKAVVTLTDKENKKYQLSLWVRPVTAYNKKIQKVCMVGNSHFRTGRQPDYLQKIATLYGQKVKVLNESTDNYMLKQHLQDAQRGKSIAASLKKADMVVFQEYGSRYTTTLDDIIQMKEYCKRDAKLYYYATDYDIYFDWEERKAALEKHGIGIIASGTLLTKMYSMGFSYEDLHDANDDHPNCVNGYVSSMLMYAKMFQEKCIDFPTKQYLNYFEPIVPGKTKAGKWKQFKKICKAADKLAANF